MLLAIDWSINVWFGLFTTAIVYVPFLLIMLRIYKHWKARHVILWAFILFLIGGYNVLSSLGSIISNDWLSTGGIIFLLSGNFLIVVFIDSVNRDSVDPVKISAISIIYAISSIGYILSMTAAPFNAAIAENLLFTAISAICVLLIWFLPGGLVLYHGARILRHVPRPLKSYAVLFLVGGILITITAFLAIAGIMIPESWPLGGLNLSGLFLVGAMASITVSLAKQPKLAYVLPFKALRLTVIDTSGGTPIFNHTWQPGRKQVDETLFSGMLQGVSVILKESLEQGNVREIILDEGTMILQRSQVKNIACVLVATRTSRALRDGLRLFSERFYERFKDDLVDPINKEAFTPAAALVAECFPFLPE
nr:hypothetical protein [Candidatus Sigynarchaeota archaeon]